jgi:zinc protease
MVTRNQDALKNVMAMPQNKFNDTVNKTIYDSHLRLVVTPRDTDFDLVKLPRVLEIYADRFSSAMGMTFILVGSFDPQEIKPLLVTYLANLPSGEIPAEFVDLKIRPVTVPVKKEVQIGVDNKATVSISFAGLSAFSEKNQFVLDAVKEIVQIKMTDVLREKLSLIYAVGVGSNFNLIPVESYQFSINLPCAPQNTDKVTAAALGEIKKIQENGPEPGDLEKFKANWRVTHRKALRDNVYWSRQIQTSALHQRTMVPSEVMEKLTDELTVKDIQDAANLYLQEGMYIQVVAMPEAK